MANPQPDRAKSRSTIDLQPIVDGVDTHKTQHVTAIVDGHDCLLARADFESTRQGYKKLRRWMQSYGAVNPIGVESTGSSGASLLRYFNQPEIDVCEVPTSDKTDRRKRGKSEALDAENDPGLAGYSGHRQIRPGALAQRLDRRPRGTCPCTGSISVKKTDVDRHVAPGQAGRWIHGPASSVRVSIATDETGHLLAGVAHNSTQTAHQKARLELPSRALSEAVQHELDPLIVFSPGLTDRSVTQIH